MGILPIGPNNPLLKLFRTEQKQGKDTKADGPATPGDVVELSKTAKQRLDGIRNLSSKNPGEVREVAENTRDILQETGLTLGLKDAVT